MVRDAETGLLADVGNATDLAQKILWMLEHGDQRERMSAAARALALRDFTVQRQAAACKLLYENHLSAQPESRGFGLENKSILRGCVDGVYDRRGNYAVIFGKLFGLPPASTLGLVKSSSGIRVGF